MTFAEFLNEFFSAKMRQPAVGQVTFEFPVYKICPLKVCTCSRVEYVDEITIEFSHIISEN